ncbi:MAG: sugar phosphate nucleotidyltransferase [candidate division WOR-3 bacterium]|nr:sugar phosphate nucleotidyltransferase [candidate division WOR-3 bacterium]
MKGVVLAGGLGTRLNPLTRITNKHLLPVYDQPMIYFPIQKLVQAGIQDIIIVTGGNSAGDFLRLLKNGKEFGLRRLHYTYQEGEGGIAEALGLTEEFAEGERVVVILGDNIFEDDLTPYIKSYQNQKEGAKILLKEVPYPERFGVAEIKDNKIISIVEKPKEPKSNYAVTGIYMYDQEVYSVIKTLKPSARGELEITDVNNYYLQKNKLTYDILPGWWADAGTSFAAYYRAITLVRELRLKNNQAKGV